MLLLIPLIFLSVLVLASANPVPQEPVMMPLRWVTQFGTHFIAGSELELAWAGGDGTCEVYYVPRWPGQHKYDLLTIQANATEKFMWNIPTFEDYPKGTTIILGIKGTYQPYGADWYDLTPALPLLAKGSDEAKHIDRITEEQIAIALAKERLAAEDKEAEDKEKAEKKAKEEKGKAEEKAKADKAAEEKKAAEKKAEEKKAEEKKAGEKKAEEKKVEEPAKADEKANTDAASIGL